MQHDQAHAFPDTPGDALDDLVIDPAMILVTPPDQHVGFVKTRLRQAMVVLLHRRRRSRNRAVGVQCVGDRVVHPLGIDFGDDLVGALMDVLAPNHCPDGHVQSPACAAEALREFESAFNFLYNRALRFDSQGPAHGETRSAAEMFVQIRFPVAGSKRWTSSGRIAIGNRSPGITRSRPCSTSVSSGPVPSTT